MKLAYFVHDLSDAAVLRRVKMLRCAGADVKVFGFDRSADAPKDVAGAPAICLGKTFDGRLSQRAQMVARQLLSRSRLRRTLDGFDVILARNLEMLIVAAFGRNAGTRLVYECLDIHRLMIRRGLAGMLLRALERFLLHRCDLVVTSSPAFERCYFRELQDVGRSTAIPVLLVENNVLDLEPGRAPDPPPTRPQGPPWRIGWFGMIRCRTSFDMLCRLAAAMPGQVEVVISGRPSDHEFQSFETAVTHAPGVRFTGAYGATDLPRMYGDVHFAWAIDYFEAGANSNWLLPNRIYESAAYGAVPIALQSVETGRWLAERRLGVLVEDPVNELAALLGGLDADGYASLQKSVQDAPHHWFKSGPEDCSRLVQALAGPA